MPSPVTCFCIPILRESYNYSYAADSSGFVHPKYRYCLICAIIKALFTINRSLGEAEIDELSRNDRRLAVASPNGVAYRQVDDPILTPQILTPLQISDFHRHRGYFGHELEALHIDGGNRACGQSSALWRLRRFSGARASGLAKTLGRLDISGLCRLWHRNRNRSTYNEHRPNRIARRHRREPFGHRAAARYFSLFLDTTPTLRRRHLCAA